MDQEKVALTGSVVANTLLGVLGIVFFWATQSQAILLDGFFNFIAFALGLLSLKVASKVKQPGDTRFNFGYYSHEPLLNTLKSIVILLICLLSLVSAVLAIFQGGRLMNFGNGLVYASIAVVACFVVGLYQTRQSKKVSSPLLEVEAKNWMINGLISTVVGLAFLASIFLQGTAWEYLTPFVDPALIILIIILVIAVPLRTLAENVNELMQSAPPKSVQEEVTGLINTILDENGMVESRIRMAKLGRVFYVMVHVVVSDTFANLRLRTQDEIRSKIDGALVNSELKVETDVLFTLDKKWLV